MGKITVKSQRSNIMFTAFKITAWMHYKCKAVSINATEIQNSKKLRKRRQVLNEYIAYWRP